MISRNNEELECAATIGSKTADRVEVTAQIGNVEDGLADVNRGSTCVEHSLLVPCGNAVSGKQSAIVVSNLEATVPLNVTSDRVIVVGSTDATGVVGVQDGREIDRVTSVVDGKGQTMVQQAAPAKSKFGTILLEVGLQISRSNCEAIGPKNVAKVWSVVSPSKRATTDLKKQEFASENIRCTSAFDALVIEQEDGENDAGKKLELVCGDTVSKSGKNSSPTNVKQQQSSSKAGARVKEQATGTLTIPNIHAAAPEQIELVAK
ncbi:hypothetical protein A4A49_06915 [Nicotiana attenuata]|uniref:Uncharacterized protein n=1 Tax=Nicotiana attenuata TaxID=49451 RepID=A0A1J6IJH8_NICAT|nr:hypothetical protein A4A49_06915 [Nicotiana attenuata]